jgi:hypothetical protein
MNDALIVGAVLIILVSALGFYLLSRLAYVEKKMGLMEAVLIDIKMALESIEQEQEHLPPPVPQAPLPASAVMGAPGSMEASLVKEEADDKFYNSVLDQVHEDEAVLPSTASNVSATSATSATSAISAASLDEEEAPVNTKVGPNYDAMTRNELVTLAEQRGLRVPKRLGRGEVITLLRKSDSPSNDSSTTGTDNASGPAGSIFATAAPIGGNFAVDLGQNDSATLEEANL